MKIGLHFILRTLLYVSMSLALFYLYSPMNKHPENKTISAIQFVYQQF
ncbi:MAG TPA: hypothetical protein PLI68_05645 [Bacteroidia bacterium]|nr:hypothetical protein [Bacteroidia bacterium]HRH09001.1 hypothetical protein [Bacteroidia bacterium]HRH62792.1 hypothetical protein [Bacteroidia bacterium]